MADDLEPVAFISVESGDDFIVSFFVVRPDDATDGRSVTLIRNRKWEHLLNDAKRGVKVSDEQFPEDEECDENFLEWIRFGNSTVELKSKRYHHKLDLRRVDASQLRAAKKVIRKMDYDKRFKLNWGLTRARS